MNDAPHPTDADAFVQLPPELQQLRILLKSDIDEAITTAMNAAASQFEHQAVQGTASSPTSPT